MPHQMTQRSIPSEVVAIPSGHRSGRGVGDLDPLALMSWAIKWTFPQVAQR
jgi:hypothetical protein